MFYLLWKKLVHCDAVLHCLTYGFCHAFHRYGEVLKMLGTRNLPNRMQDHIGFRGIRRRHGSLSSLPSSSVSSRPIRDRKRNDDRRKVRDIKVSLLIRSCIKCPLHEVITTFIFSHIFHRKKGINKRFQRLESHVVTLARSVSFFFQFKFLFR